MSDDFYFCSHCGHEGGLGGEAVQEEIIDKIMEAIENKYAGLTRKDVEGLIEELIALEQRIINDEYLSNISIKIV